MLSANMVELAYLFAAVLIIFALKGLASPETARRGNMFGMLGLGIAALVTLQMDSVQNYAWIVAAIAVGGLFGGGGGGILGELNPINWIKSGIGQLLMLYIAIKLLFKFIDKI